MQLSLLVLCSSSSPWHPAGTNLPPLKQSLNATCESVFFWSSTVLFSAGVNNACHAFVKRKPHQKWKHSHLMSPKSFLFPAMATTMSSGPCSFNSFTHFFSVWKESWMTRAQQALSCGTGTMWNTYFCATRPLTATKAINTGRGKCHDGNRLTSLVMS